MKPEEILQCKVVEYIRVKYPEIIFCSSMAGIKLPSIGAAVKAKRMGNTKGIPDLMIFEPRTVCEIPYHALFIELKSDDGVLNDMQARTLDKLRAKGYAGYVCFTFAEAKKAIDEYLKEN